MQISRGRTAACTLLVCTMACVVLLSASSESNQSLPLEIQDWPVYGGTPENTHYSRLAQLNRTNVKQLEVAWSFDTGERGGLQTSPIIVDGILHGITATQKVFALDAADSTLLWKFDSGI